MKVVKLAFRNCPCVSADFFSFSFSCTFTSFGKRDGSECNMSAWLIELWDFVGLVSSFRLTGLRLKSFHLTSHQILCSALKGFEPNFFAGEINSTTWTWKMKNSCMVCVLTISLTLKMYFSRVARLRWHLITAISQLFWILQIVSSTIV